MQANDKKYLKTKDAKQKFGYPTTRQPVANKKSVRAEKPTNLQPDSLADDDLPSSPPKSLEDVIPPSTKKKRKEKKKSARSEVKLNTTAVNDNLLSSSPLQSLEEDEIPETTGKNKHNQREKSFSIGKSPTSEITLHPAVNDDKSSSSPTSSEEDEIDHVTILDTSSNFDSKLVEYEAKCDKLERVSYHIYILCSKVKYLGQFGRFNTFILFYQENRALKEQIAKNEVDLETYYNEIASKELQNQELCDQLEAIQKAQPIELIKGNLNIQLCNINRHISNKK